MTESCTRERSSALRTLRCPRCTRPTRGCRPGLSVARYGWLPGRSRRPGPSLTSAGHSKCVAGIVLIPRIPSVPAGPTFWGCPGSDLSRIRRGHVTAASRFTRRSRRRLHARPDGAESLTTAGLSVPSGVSWVVTQARKPRSARARAPTAAHWGGGRLDQESAKRLNAAWVPEPGSPSIAPV